MGTTDGPLGTNRLSTIFGICSDTDGTIYWTEGTQFKVRKLDTDGEVKSRSQLFSAPTFQSCVVGKDKIYLTAVSPPSIWTLDKVCMLSIVLV
mmetsp:Transcript_7578/g.18249  ORF Transcript_7578/g.18249 Transcript_7578/m.18249 type:complete len:93 (-) Transcript_7578:882-1160(-)